MSKDLDIIKKLEKKLDREFATKLSEEIDLGTYTEYELNNAEEVIKLRLYNLELTEIPVEMAKLVNLQQLYLSNN